MNLFLVFFQLRGLVTQTVEFVTQTVANTGPLAHTLHSEARFPLPFFFSFFNEELECAELFDVSI